MRCECSCQDCWDTSHKASVAWPGGLMWTFGCGPCRCPASWRPRDPVMRGASGETLPPDLEIQGKEPPRKDVYLAYWCCCDTVLKEFSALENTCAQKNDLLVIVGFSWKRTGTSEDSRKSTGFRIFWIWTSDLQVRITAPSVPLPQNKCNYSLQLCMLRHSV